MTVPDTLPDEAGADEVDAAGLDAAEMDAAGMDPAGVDAGGMDAAGVDAAGVGAAGGGAAAVDAGQTGELDEDVFWALLDLVGDLRGPRDPYRELVTALSALPVERITAFDQTLARMLHQLDRRDLADVVISWQRVRYLCDDLFLHLRCGIVAAGRDAHRAVLADPEAALPLLHWDQQDEGLLAVADAAHLAVTGLPRPRPDYRFEYESRSNAAGWAQDGHPPAR